MDIGKLYEKLSKMTSKQRVEYIEQEHKAMQLQLTESKKLKVGYDILNRLDEIFEEEREDYIEECGDNYAEAMRQNIGEIIRQDDRLWDLMQEYMEWVI